jgi:O-antigen/teichoic acid export membrane protein
MATVQADDPVAKSARRPAFVQTCLTFGTNISAGALSLVNVLVISRALGPGGRGEVVFLLAVANLTHYLSTLGVQDANINFASTMPASRRSLATNSVFLAAVLGALGAGVVVLLISIVPAIGGDASPLWLGLALGTIPILILQNYLMRLIQADYRFAASNSLWLLGPVVNVVGNSLFYAAGIITVGSAVTVWIVGQTLACSILVYYVARRLAGFGRPDFQLARSALAFGVRSHGGGMMMIGNYRLDQWIMGATRPASDLGLYSVAVAWAETLFFLPEAVRMVLRPDLARARRNDAAAQTEAATRLTLLVTALLAGAIALLAPFLCETVFGSSFSGSVFQLRLLVGGAIGVAMIKLLGSALTAQRKPLLESAAIGIGLLATVLLDAWLIPAYGGVGASVASTVSYNIGGIAAALIFAHALRTRVSRLVPRPREAVEQFRTIAARLRPASTPAAQES